MTGSTHEYRSLNVGELLNDGEKLIAVATIAVNDDGEYSLHIVDVVGAPITMTPAQKANALRQLATGVEAEAIFRGDVETEQLADNAAAETTDSAGEDDRG